MLFIVGSFLFGVGSFPPYSQLVDGRAVGFTFVVGGLFFTAGGYSAFLQVINDGRETGAPFTLWAWPSGTKLWWAAFIQLIGTLLFNVNTLDAMIATFTVEETNRLVWGPDMFGSIAFLVASHLFWLNVRGSRRNETDDADWWAAVLNYIGSVFFVVSAIASFTLETTGETINITVVNSGTFLGAICFLAGSYLGLPPTDSDDRGATAGRPPLAD